MNSQAPARGISQLFFEVAMWAAEKGADDLANKPGLWEGELGEFHVAINAHGEELKTCDGLTCPPLSLVVNAPKYLGAVIICDAAGGIGSTGMEDDVLKALAAAKDGR